MEEFCESECTCDSENKCHYVDDRKFNFPTVDELLSRYNELHREFVECKLELVSLMVELQSNSDCNKKETIKKKIKAVVHSRIHIRGSIMHYWTKIDQIMLLAQHLNAYVEYAQTHKLSISRKLYMNKIFSFTYKKGLSITRQSFLINYSKLRCSANICENFVPNYLWIDEKKIAQCNANCQSCEDGTETFQKCVNQKYDPNFDNIIFPGYLPTGISEQEMKFVSSHVEELCELVEICNLHRMSQSLESKRDENGHVSIPCQCSSIGPEPHYCVVENYGEMICSHGVKVIPCFCIAQLVSHIGYILYDTYGDIFADIVNSECSGL
jgi:hypothetical protein